MEDQGSAELPLDVDAVLQQLKLAKDKELRLRVEKDRVRKELEALRTGDLWTREAATQRELEAIQARRRSLQSRETVENERLRVLDDELCEKEAALQRKRRELLTASSAIKQAAMVTLASTKATEPTPSTAEGPQKHSALANPTAANRIVSTLTPGKEEDGIARKQMNTYRRSSNQEDDDAVAQLAFSIDLEKQQSRIKRLEQQIEQSQALQQRAERPWDVRLLATPTDRSRLKPATGHVINEGCSRVEEKSVPMLRDNATLASRAPMMQEQTTHGAQAAKMIQESPSQNPGWVPPPLHVPNPLAGDARIPYQFTQTPVAPAYSLATIPPVISPFPPGMFFPAYSMYPSPAVVPMMVPPSTNGMWGYSTSLGVASPAYPLPSYFHPSPFPLIPSIPPPSYQSMAGASSTQDVVGLHHQLDALRKNEQQSDEDKEFTQVQELLTGLQHQVAQLTRSQSAEVELETIDSNPNYVEVVDSGLKSIKRQHLEAVLKVRNERDLLEEQDKLEEMQERVEKRREERKRDMNREVWVTKHKQELMELRLQRAVAKMDPSISSATTLVPDQNTSTRLYDPETGVLFCWDFVSGLPAVNKAQLTFAVYDGKILRSPIKTVSSKECESEGPSHKRAIFAANRVVKPLPVSSDTVVVFEVSSVTSATADNSTIRRLGWAAIGLFRGNEPGGSLELASEWLRVQLATTSMPDPASVLIQGYPSTDTMDSGSVVLYFRVVHGELEEQAQATPIDPDVHAGRYRSPNVMTSQQKVPPTDQSVTTTTPSSTVPSSNTGVESETRAHNVFPPTREEFVDIERLRLLSSSSATSRPPSRLLRPRSTLSAVPRGRATGGTSTLPIVPEATSFDSLSSTSPWIQFDTNLDRQRRLARKSFQAGDAFDIYVDGARFLPENISVTKVTVAALNADRTKITPFTEDTIQIAADKSDVCSPLYNLYVEYREKVFDPTLTLVFRLDTLDVRSKQPVILAYALFPVFLDADSHVQPLRSNCTDFQLNHGAFQLPLFTNAVLNDPTMTLSAVSAVATMPRFPCATLLIRVKAAMMSEDGLQVLTRKTVPLVEWVARGLDEPPPAYHLGTYDSSSCVPTPLEMKMYLLRDLELKKRMITVQQAVKTLGLDPSLVSSLFPPKPTLFMELRSAFRYLPAIGFRVSIDSLHNLKLKAGSFCRVLYSVVPPGAFYQSIRLTNGVHFTTTTDWTSLPTSPEFRDGYVTFRDIPANPRMVLVIDVRAVTKNPKTNAYMSQPLAWSFMPILDNKTVFVVGGSFQIPLFVGEVKLEAIESVAELSTLIDDIAAERKKTLMPFMDNASVFVRLEDPQVPIVSPLPPITGAIMSSMTPTKSIPRYLYDPVKVALAKKKSPLSKLLPPGFTEKQLDADINRAFAMEMGLHHN